MTAVVFECVWCGTDTTVPACGPGLTGGYTCRCGSTFHRPEANTQTLAEFLARAAHTDLLPCRLP